MDNPWAENWADDPTPKTETLPTTKSVVTTSSKSAWSLPPTTVVDTPIDIVNPTWDATSSLQWNHSDAESSSWGKTTEFASAWDADSNTSERSLDAESFPLPVSNGSAFTDTEVASSKPSLELAQIDHVSPFEDTTPPSPVVLPPPQVHHISPGFDEADGYGTFATVEEEENDPQVWDQSVGTLSNATDIDDGWGDSWGEAQPAFDDGKEEFDEWEAARNEKEKQDKHVPPERLDEILQQFKNISPKLWPDAQEGTIGGSQASRLDSVVSDATLRMLLPEDLTLAMHKPFSQSFVYKRENEALKLSRNNLVTRKGPMTMYMASKGSTSWEASVKTRETSAADAVPVGWKIVPKEDQKMDDPKEKKVVGGGGLLSFFSRRTASSTPEDVTARLSRPVSPANSVSKGATNSTIEDTNPIALSQTPTQSGFHSSTTAVGSVNGGTPESLLSPNSARSTQDFFPTEEPKDAQPASAVSRFLGRFSRNSRSPNTNRESVALSSDDLEFLSDVVPTTQMHASEDDQLKALTNLIHSKPHALPTALPPPLAPPPRRTQDNRTPTIPSKPPQATTVEEDLFSLFDSTMATNNSTNQSHPLPSIPASDTLHFLGSDNSLYASTSSFPSTSSVASPLSTFFSSEGNMSMSPFQSSSSVPRFDGPPPPPPPKVTRTSSPASRPTTPSLFHRNPTALGSAPTLPQLPTFSPNPLSLIAPLAPPPSSRSHTPSLVATTSDASHNALTRDDDDFAEFIASPSDEKPTQHASFSSFGSFGPFDTKSKTSIVSKGQTTSSFSDFGDFDFASVAQRATDVVKPPISRPSSSVGVVNARSVLPSQQATIQVPSRVSQWEHQRTISLVETAASRGDTWLGPPSPLPMALAPPQSSSSEAGDPYDIFAQQSSPAKPVSGTVKAPNPISAVISPPPPPPPPANQSRAGSGGWSFPPPPVLNKPLQPSRNASPAPVKGPQNLLAKIHARAASPPVSTGASSAWSFPSPPKAPSRTSSPAPTNTLQARTAPPPVAPTPASSTWSFPPPPSSNNAPTRATVFPANATLGLGTNSTVAPSPVTKSAVNLPTNWSFPPPPSSKHTSPRATPSPAPTRTASTLSSDFSNFMAPQVKASPPPSKALKSSSGGGLNAQDLAFFEGL
ncbi:hypothetical protein FA15DRAFT_674863 [Coprinopsis marcescibilis]|uniref:Uncharacterized protein n=1 Tax=Coprinopsis marcescibilis TaxID=230819 RepID=A0A5C3KGC9_COPMA|nr:hypothetical protein FA15DRAFT_674863 [Coprinopsis marcescibilis]